MTKPETETVKRRCSACDALKNIGLSHKCAGDRCYWDYFDLTRA